MLVIVVQTYKNIPREKLAKYLVTPIKYESCRRWIQGWLSLKVLTFSAIWRPIIQEIIKRKFGTQTSLKIVLARTEWGERNIFIVSGAWEKRALSVSCTLLNKKGASNLSKQKELLTPVFALIKEYKLIIIGDQKFDSTKLGECFKQKKVTVILRQRKNTNIREKNGKDYPLEERLVIPGRKTILTEVEVTLESPSYYNMLIDSQRKYGKRKE